MCVFVCVRVLKGVYLACLCNVLEFVTVFFHAFMCAKGICLCTCIIATIGQKCKIYICREASGNLQHLKETNNNIVCLN